MALRYVAIEKEIPFQNRTERFSNVYLMETSASDDAAYAALVNAIVAAEQPVHTAAVAFKKARVYSTSGLNGVLDSGSMYFVGDLTGVGTGAPGASDGFYNECAILVRWPLPRKVGPLGGLGRQRSLKKFLHTGGAPNLTLQQQKGTTNLSGLVTTTVLTYANAVKAPIAGSQMVAPDGTLPNASPNVAPYLEHRQFPRGRKETV